VGPSISVPGLLCGQLIMCCLNEFTLLWRCVGRMSLNCLAEMSVTELWHEMEKPSGFVLYLVASGWQAPFFMMNVVLALVSLNSLSGWLPRVTLHCLLCFFSDLYLPVIHNIPLPDFWLSVNALYRLH
jgi:hypothetical protein